MALTQDQQWILIERFPSLATYCYNEHFKHSAPIRDRETYKLYIQAPPLMGRWRFYDALKAITHLGIGTVEVILDHRLKPALEERAKALNISLEDFKAALNS